MDEPGRERTLRIEKPEPGKVRLTFLGPWTIREGIYPISDVERALGSASGLKTLTLDAQAVSEWDSGFVILLRKISDLCRQSNVVLDDAGLPQEARTLFKLAAAAPVAHTHDDPMENSLLTRIGDISIRLTRTWEDTLGFVGEVFLSLLRFLRGKAQFRRSDLWTFIEEAGVHALPLVSLVSFLIGIIVAFIGALQLQTMGAEAYVAQLVAVAVVRELGPMMTAIVVAARSGASYAASIGTMVVNEEVDALKTLGVSPVDFLVTPRLLALTLMLPLLVLYADFVGMLGGAVISKLLLNVSFGLYYSETISSLRPVHFLLGLIKAGIYGALVAFAGCLCGMQSGRSAAAVGAATHRASVSTMVLIIVASAVTTIIFSLFGF